MKTMKFLRDLVLVLAFVLPSFSAASDKFPVMPVESVTPGDLCEDSPVRRYPENIVYCERNVDTQLKNEIIKMYDEKFGYQIRKMNRGDFKIDHFIPLSIGGSNSIDNLWPQHRSVYEVTDELELLLYEKLSQAKIKQAEAIRVMREAKTNLDRVPELKDYINHF